MSVNEGETIGFTLQLDAALTDGLILIDNAPFGGTATNGTDYTSSDTAAGGAYQTPSYTFSGTTVTRLSTGLLVITDDNAAEGAETITWTWAIHSGSSTTDTVTLSPASITVTILANDGYTPPTPTPTPSFSIAVDESTRAEGETAVFTVTLAGGAPSGGVTVDWAVSGAGITADDYTLSGADTDGTLSFTANGSQTLTFAITDDSAGEGDETLTVTLSNPSAGSITTASASTAITDDDTLLTVTGPARIAEGAAATYTITLTGVAFAAATTVTWAVTHGTTTDADFTGGVVMGTVDFATSDTSGATRTFMLTAAEDGVSDAESFTLNITSAGLPAGTHIGPALTIAVTDDDPAARAARVKTPLATFAKSATQLTAQAVSRRIHFDGTNTFNVSPAKDLLHQSAFSLAHANGGMNLWATGGRLSASGDHNGTNYNGDTDAIHIGVDTEWNNGLLGIAISQASGETNFTHDGIRSTLESDLAGVHPYLTRTLTDVQLWATAGIGDGEARLREGGSVDTGLSLLSAAAGVVYAPRPNASFHVAGQWSRAELDAATFTDGRELPKVTAAAARLAGGVELSQAFGDWRPFFTVSLRRDSGDGDTGDAADYGGGVEWQNRAVHLRLAGRKHAQGKGPNEENLTLTARKTAGRLNLGLNLTAASGLNTADLLSGELRF